MTKHLPKIAYLTGEYPRASDTFIQREVAALRDIGHEVITCSIRTTGPEHLVGPEQREEHQRTFKVLDAAKNPLTLLSAHLHLLRTPKKYASAFALAWRTSPPGLKARLFQFFYFLEAGVLAKRLIDENVDHLHNHIAKASCTVAMLVGELSDISWSFTIHGPDIFFEPHHWRIDEKATRARFVSCISHFCRSQLLCFADNSHSGKFHIVHCGIDVDRYQSANARNGNSLLFVGRMAGVKGVPVLLDAVETLSSEFPDLQLNLIGDGSERASLEDSVASRGLANRVKFLGFKSQSDVAEALTTTDVFVLPSFAEGVPVVLMEAMGAKVPVVTTRIAGVPELVEDGVSGALVPPGDPSALATALAEILRDSDMRKAMGQAGRERVSAEFNIKQEAAWLSELVTQYSQNPDPKLPLRPEEHSQ